MQISDNYVKVKGKLILLDFVLHTTLVALA